MDIKITICIITVLSISSGILGRLPTHQKCANENCSEVISYGQTTLNYLADHKNVLSFQSGEKVTVFSKADGHWGVKIRGKFGYVPNSFVRETKVVTRTLPFSVPISDGVENKSSESATPARGLSDDSVDTLQKIRVLGEPFMDKEPSRSELNIMEVPNVDNSPTDVKQYVNSGNLAEKDVSLDESLVALEKAGDHLNPKAIEDVNLKTNIESMVFNDNETLKENLVEISVEKALEDSMNNSNIQSGVASTTEHAEVDNSVNNPSVNYTVLEELPKNKEIGQMEEIVETKDLENHRDEKVENVYNFVENSKDGYSKEMDSEVLLKNEDNLKYKLPAGNQDMPKDINVKEVNLLVDDENAAVKYNQTVDGTIFRESLKNEEYGQDNQNPDPKSTEIVDDVDSDFDDIEGEEQDNDDDPLSEDEDADSLDPENLGYEESTSIRPGIVENTIIQTASDSVNENQSIGESKNSEEVDKERHLESSISLSQRNENLDKTSFDKFIGVSQDSGQDSVDYNAFTDSVDSGEKEGGFLSKLTTFFSSGVLQMDEETNSKKTSDNEKTQIETKQDQNMAAGNTESLDGHLKEEPTLDQIESVPVDNYLYDITGTGVPAIEETLANDIRESTLGSLNEKDGKAIFETLTNEPAPSPKVFRKFDSPVEGLDAIIKQSDNSDLPKADYKPFSYAAVESMLLDSINLGSKVENMKIDKEEMLLEVDSSVEGLDTTLKDSDSISRIPQADEKPLDHAVTESTPHISTDTGSKMAEDWKISSEEVLFEAHITNDIDRISSFPYGSINHQENESTSFAVSADQVEKISDGVLVNLHETVGGAHSIHSTDQQNSLPQVLTNDKASGSYVDNENKVESLSKSMSPQHEIVDNLDSVVQEPLSEVEDVPETHQQDLFSHSSASEYHHAVGSSSDSNVAPEGYCDAANQICDSASVVSHTRSLLGNNVDKEESYVPEESEMLSDIFLPPKIDLLILLISVGTGIAVLLVLLEAVKLSLHKAGLVKKFNVLQSQLERSLGEIKVLNDEKNSVEKKKISLQEKFCEVEDCCKDLRSKIEELTVENDLVKKEKAVWDQRFDELFTTSEEQGKMNAQLLAMQDELVAEKAEIEALLGVKEQESDTYRKELIDLRESYSTLEVQLANALEKAAQLDAAEAKCSQLLSEKCNLQIAAQSFETEKSKLESSLNNEKLENRSLKALLNQLQSIGGSVPAGQMDALLDAEKIRTEMKSTKEECDALKKQLFEMNDSCTTLQGMNEELKQRCDDLESRLAIEVEDRKNLKIAIDVLKNMFETEKAELVEKLTMYKGVSDSESSIIKKFEQKLDQARTNEVTLNQTIKDLQNQIHEFDLVAKEQTESYSAGMRQATQQAVEAQIKNRRLETRNQELDRECANLRRKLAEMASQMRDANSNVSPDDTGRVLLNGNHDALLPPQQPGLLPLGFPPLPPFLPPFLPPPEMSFMDRPSTLGMGSPPFDSPYYDDRGTPNSMRAFSPRSHSPTGSERSGSYRRRRDHYRPESVGRSRDSSPAGNTYDRRRGRSPSDRDV
ncbi:uncharacterized protein LOC136028752 isoform X2 [Artemia franciscana]|uniref:SH3 domain-containing protein n=1 Tax=Artemia franciscana TaxID=6661 RepID=A0AA88L061_ARTSF|nr:hypothetical protein QYM36_015529 [Artemia franciscana]